MIKRQVRWKIKTDTAEQEALRHKWSFCIINTPIEIERIKQRILENLAVCDDYSEIAKGSIAKTDGINYIAFSLSSNKGILTQEEKNRIYKGNFYKERTLPLSKYNTVDIWFEEMFIPRL